MANETQIVLKVDEKKINAFGILTDAKEMVQKLKESGLHPLQQYAYGKNLKKSVDMAVMEVLPQELVEQLMESDPKVKEAIEKGQPIYFGSTIIKPSHYRRYGYMGNGIPEEHKILEKRLVNTMQEVNDLLVALKPMRKRAVANGTAEVLVDKPCFQFLGDAVDLKEKSGKVGYEPTAGFGNNFDGEGSHE
ncbi:MAG: hypothetical protein IKN59_06130 [Paludibacteraceae bacterium]|nr:hypothetical protein [Paludibacteraceae bacterium]